MVDPAANCRIAESLGCILQNTRLDNGWDTAEVAEHLGIPERWLVAAEADQWNNLPDDAYSRIYFQAYVKLLKLEPKALASLYRQVRRREAVRRPATPDEIEGRRHPTRAIPFWSLITAPRAIRNGLLILLGLGLLSYLWWATANIVTPPRIAISAPSDGLVTTERSVTVSGQTEDEVSLWVNGKEVTPDSDGNFIDTLNLAEGLNTIKVVGSKKHSKETVVTRRVIVAPEE
jgi:cytoskeletal protein RodZ